MFKKLGLVFIWFSATPSLLLISALLFTHKPIFPKIAFSHPQKQEEAVKVASSNTMNAEILPHKVGDIRPYMVEKFLKNTPLKPYSQYMVEVADKYSIDYRWIPAIAMKESGAGAAAPNNSFNAWGFENGRTKFVSWEQAIDRVGKTLKERYIDKGLTTAELIMPIYAPPAVENGGGWAQAINLYFSKMESL